MIPRILKSRKETKLEFISGMRLLMQMNKSQWLVKYTWKKFNLKVLEHDIWKVFEMYNPLKILSFYENAKKSPCDLASPISSVLIPPGISPLISVCVCVCVGKSPSVGVLMHIYVCEWPCIHCPFSNLLWTQWNFSTFTSESAQWVYSELIRGWTLNAKQIIALASDQTSQN